MGRFVTSSDSQLHGVARMAVEKKHRGFKEVQKEISKKSGVSMEAAGAILASSARNASPAAKRANPSLKKVKG